MAEIKFTAQTYYNAAREHLVRSLELHEARQYVLAPYIAGVAIECILRAYGRRVDDEFEGRHSLTQLARKARYYELASEDEQARHQADILEADTRWRSNQRFMTEAHLRQHLNLVGIDARIKGDRLKYNSRTMYDLAYRIVGLGVTKWKP